MTLRRKQARGFTLIETLVALAIAAVILNGFYSALSTGSLLDRRAAEQADKVMTAITVLDRVGVDIPLSVGTVENGRANGLNWELLIGNTPPRDMQLGPIYAGELIFISVSVTERDGGADPVVLRAIRFAGEPL